MKKGGFTLPKAERISGSREFGRIFKRGKRIRFPEVTLVVAQNHLPFSRMGIGVGRRFGNAVKRNRAKRLCRELFRLNKYRIPKGIDIVFLPRPAILGARWYKLQKNMEKAGKIIEKGINTEPGRSQSHFVVGSGNSHGI